MSTRASKG